MRSKLHVANSVRDPVGPRCHRGRPHCGAGFAQVETQQPSLSETDGSGPVMMWISREFIDAMAAGTDQLAALLATIEARHFSSLERAIVKGAEA